MKLVIEELKKNYGEKKVLKGINFTFEKGKIYGLLGRNGAGKTTFFDCLNEDTSISSGKVYIEEEGNNRPLQPEEIGYVLSTPVVPEFLTGREFLTFFMDINKDQIKNKKTVDEYFDFLKIDVEDRDKMMKDYSHGMKNKMQMLISIILSPHIILLDEPLTSFDIVVADEMKKMLKSIKKEHILIFSTHILELAVDLCDEIVILNNGVLEQVKKDKLNDREFEAKIVASLKGE